MKPNPATSLHPPELGGREAVVLAVWVSLAALVSLGITRFAYGLLLPPMRDDLGWSYTLAGAMNTANAAGYLLGALTLPRLMARWGVVRVLLWGVGLASLFMVASGGFVQAPVLLAQRLLAGVASAWAFVAGGVLAARLGALRPERAGWLLGLYYGGTGWGIVISALGVPVVLSQAASWPHAWQAAWLVLGACCALATWRLMRRRHRLEQVLQLAMPSGPATASPGKGLPWSRMSLALAGYGLFGVGYIGYMTFVVALLREQGHGSGTITAFYALLGLAVVASSRIWSGLLDRARGGGALATLNALLAVATGVPVLTDAPWALWGSGALFGAVFLSIVASTTAFVRHNLSPEQWTQGIAAFTLVFAAGQIVGPTVVGWVADGAGGLVRGLGWSALALALGAVLAWRQPSLHQ